jgi:ABC-type uncharacterized transport system substrate-binding protein
MLPAKSCAQSFGRRLDVLVHCRGGGLLINQKTAKSLGIVFPTSILLRADEVIE